LKPNMFNNFQLSHQFPFKGVKKEVWFVCGFCCAKVRSEYQFMGVRIFITGAFISKLIALKMSISSY